MGIIKTNKETEEYINSFMDKNDERENGPSISNYQLSSLVTLYKEMLESDNGSVCQFASNAGGFSSYHYYKKNDKIYLFECYMQKIKHYHSVNEKWISTQKEYLEKLHQ